MKRLKGIDVSNTTTSLDNLNKGGPPYQFKYLNNQPLNHNSQKCNHIYTFSTRYGVKYQVNILEYTFGLFAVKFHLSIHKKHARRYQILADVPDRIVVLKTMVRIMLDVLRCINNEASFAFIGMPLTNESADTTKRFKVYKIFCRRFFNPDNFHHDFDETKSFYMLLNKKRDTIVMKEEIAKIAEEEFNSDLNSDQVTFSRSTHGHRRAVR